MMQAKGKIEVRTSMSPEPMRTSIPALTRPETSQTLDANRRAEK